MDFWRLSLFGPVTPPSIPLFLLSMSRGNGEATAEGGRGGGTMLVGMVATSQLDAECGIETASAERASVGVLRS